MMRVTGAVAFAFIITIAATARAFVPSRTVNCKSTTELSAGLFGLGGNKSIGSGNANSASAKKKIDNMKKKKQYSVLLISSNARSCIKEKNLLDQKGVKYLAVEMDKEDNDEAIRAEFGVSTKTAIWIKGKSIDNLQSLDSKGELDDLLKNVPKTKHITPI
eukprot:CAMPEP_0183707222 /NCGR_PEP_ID=MMETSP0737-20130205/3846_1 /TAXON_ID=385413 /ORGANISM="Thalassiosira miniscula, Strain CCMP1093" /LENGTH=160 /DNA_ID=CAMNT_0025934825 /DNA_START=139 /DNA_END=621 /DNA_ORIENTATION=+